MPFGRSQPSRAKLGDCAARYVMVTSDQNIRHQQNLTGRQLALTVLGSNIWPIVRNHGEAIAAKVDGATPGSYDFIEMPIPPKSHSGPAKR